MGHFTRITFLVTATLCSGASCSTTTPKLIEAALVACVDIADAPHKKGYVGVKSQLTPEGVWIGGYRGEEGLAIVMIAPKAVVPEQDRHYFDGECIDPAGGTALHRTAYVTKQQLLDAAPQTKGID